MTWFKPRDLLDRTFEIGIILKGLDGILETIGGLLQILVPPASLNHPQQDPRGRWGGHCSGQPANQPQLSVLGRNRQHAGHERVGPVCPQLATGTRLATDSACRRPRAG